MGELRIPREEEKVELEDQYDCVKKGCIYVEALLSINYSMFKITTIPRIRCTINNFYLNPQSKVCGNFCR